MTIAARLRAHVRARAWLWFGGIGAALTVAYFLLPGPDEQDLFYQVPEMLAVAAIVLGVRMHRPTNAGAWWLLALGLALTAAGDWAWIVLERVFAQDPFPSLADAFYLVGMGLVAAAMWLLIRGRLPEGDRAGVLDALIVTVSAGLLTWVLLMDRSCRTRASRPGSWAWRSRTRSSTSCSSGCSSASCSSRAGSRRRSASWSGRSSPSSRPTTPTRCSR
jgi:hypothetical protein